MKRKIYRIEQMVNIGVVNDIVIMAATSNGGKKYISLKYMADYVENEKLKYPTLTKDINAELIGDNCLSIDKGTENLLLLTEVEIMELVDEDSPTLNRYSNTIADETAHEILN